MKLFNFFEKLLKKGMSKKDKQRFIKALTLEE